MCRLLLNFSDETTQTYKWIVDDILVKLGDDGSSYINEKEYKLLLQ